jgi:hypothetical protein
MFQLTANEDLLNPAGGRAFVGVETRQYGRSLEPLPASMAARGTSKSVVSQRFVARTAAQSAAWQTPLEALDLVGLLIDR